MNRPSPGDVAKWLVYTRLRLLLSPEAPGRIAALRPLGKLVPRVVPGKAALMAEEFERCGLRPQVTEAYAANWRVAVEELVLGRHTAETLDAFIRFEGIQNLEAALAHKKGVVWVYPHAGPVMLMLAWLVKHGYPYTQYAARGLPPKQVAEEHPELLGHNRFREEVRTTREEDEDKTGATFLTLEQPARELYRTLARNELVGIAFDGRIGNKWRIYDFLGRRALLNPGAWRLAASTGAMLVPCYNRYPERGPAICEVGAPIDPKAKDADLQVLRWTESRIQASPAEYGPWLLHCRLRNNIDDHPFFVDHAVDERWKKWETE
jgi:lauroyl/myristoyl acyltransferase